MNLLKFLAPTVALLIQIVKAITQAIVEVIAGIINEGIYGWIQIQQIIGAVIHAMVTVTLTYGLLPSGLRSKSLLCSNGNH